MGKSKPNSKFLKHLMRYRESLTKWPPLMFIKALPWEENICTYHFKLGKVQYYLWFDKGQLNRIDQTNITTNKAQYVKKTYIRTHLEKYPQFLSFSELNKNILEAIKIYDKGVKING